MKIIKISMLFVLSTVYVSCAKKHESLQTSVQITALIDVTDSQVVLPEAETVLSLYDFPDDKKKEAYFRLATTTDKLLNADRNLHLASDEVTERDNHMDDPDFRSKKVLEFYDSVKQTLTAFKTSIQEHSAGLTHSECFRSIAQELTRMKENKTGKSILVIYGDLEENSELCNVYRDANLQTVFTHPEVIRDRFESTNRMPSQLSGFTIMFIFLPQTREQDKLYNAILDIYRKMLTDRGAKVNSSATNQTYIQP